MCVWVGVVYSLIFLKVSSPVHICLQVTEKMRFKTRKIYTPEH